MVASFLLARTCAFLGQQRPLICTSWTANIFTSYRYEICARAPLGMAGQSGAVEIAPSGRHTIRQRSRVVDKWPKGP
jgi:hypothetical protein